MIKSQNKKEDKSAKIATDPFMLSQYQENGSTPVVTGKKSSSFQTDYLTPISKNQ